MAVLSAVAVSTVAESTREGRSVRRFQLTLLGVAGGAALLAGAAPIGVSIATLFLFAGPHNWMEFRWFLAHLPARWGPQRGFFVLAIAGALGLTAAFALIPWASRAGGWDAGGVGIAVSSWNSALALWVLALWFTRGPAKTAPRWALPLVLAAIPLAWLFPYPWDLTLVYLHPLLALVFLGRMIRQWHPDWVRPYLALLPVVPLLLGILAIALASAPGFPGEDLLTFKIANHAGASIWPSVSPRFLVASHLFLQMLHYGVWIAAVPLIGLKAAPWKLSTIPLARRAWWGKGIVLAMAAGGGAAVLALWGGFAVDYPLTRDLYFTAAMVHVLAEFPFLIRTA